MHRWRGRNICGRITEVESYVGENDKASHARFGKTMRNTVMYGGAGHSYVYLVYGMHNCLNIVTERAGFPAAVLIRGVVLVSARSYLTLPSPILGEGNLNGPGKLTRALRITRALNNEDMVSSKKLYVVDDGYRIKKSQVLTSPRIGVDYAGEDALLPWRYYLSSPPLLSKERRQR